MELIVNDISKTIRKRLILDHVSLNLEGGKIYGFVGRNGSGKTMLFRALSGLMRVDSGSIAWNGKILHKDFSVLPSLGIVIENASLYPSLTGIGNLTYLAKLTGRIGHEEIVQAITRVGLDPYDKRVYGKYSLGMKQRLAVAQAIMEKPDVIMLDEPMNALDGGGIEEMRKIIFEEKDRGALILISTHNREDVRDLVDKWYRVDNGQVIEQESGI